MNKVLSARLDEETIKRLEIASKKSKMDKTSFLRIILLKGLEKTEEEEALNRYESGEISLGKLSELLNKTYWDTLDLLKEKKIPFNYSEEDLKEDLEILKT